MSEYMLTPFTFLWRPRKVYENLKSKPYWAAPFILTVFGLVLLSLFNNAWSVQLSIVQMRLLLFNIVFTTLIVLFLWSVVAVFLYLSIFIIDEQNSVSFRSLFSIVSYCGVITMIAEIINFLLIHAKLIDDVLYSLPMQFPYGLDILTLTSNPHYALAYLLHSINPFTIWYYIILSMGLSIVAGLNKKEARMLSFTIFLCQVGFRVSYILVTREPVLRIMVH
jgi:hypothetical protein